MHKNEGRKPHQCFHKSGGKQRGVSVSMCVCPECPHQYNENGLFLLLALQSYPNCAAAGFIIMYPGRPVGA